MPVLFALTLFVSASLLFMVQPMVGKMVLPLLGGSPAVWNACMVFFQALLLLGYLYAHHVSAKYQPRQQWLIHDLVLGLPLAAFLLAVMFGVRHSPIAVAESLAPGGNTSPILSVFLLLTVAIGIPFFVVSTSAPLLQKWFTCTGHPSARDPYFLYSASNFGSMISLLGYPLFIEPNMTITGQAWVFAGGFALLAVLVGICGYAAANPISVPPSSAQLLGNKQLQKSPQQSGQNINSNATNPPPPAVAIGDAPSIFRKLKWVTLAFVPSSLMLGVTFYMTTDIASIPLLWVLPLTLYLVTFIIAFARLPDWFRLVIGNLAPVVILLLVFVILSNVVNNFAGLILINLATFFAAALMCHYELSRDRPSPKYLTEFFLLMSAGGVLGGIFNSLLAPVIFAHSYEYKIVLILACLMVPRLTDVAESAKSKPKEKPKTEAELKKASQATENESGNAGGESLYDQIKPRIPLILDIVIPVAGGIIFYYMQKLPSSDWFGQSVTWVSESIGLSTHMIAVIVIFAVPIMICFFFVDRPLRFALCVAALLGPRTYKDEGSSSIYSERSFFGILKIEKEIGEQRPAFTLDSFLSDSAFDSLKSSDMPEAVISKLLPLRNTRFASTYLDTLLSGDDLKKYSDDEKRQWKTAIANATKAPDPERVRAGEITYLRLVHGTTLHGMQISKMRTNVFDTFQCLTALNPWDNILVAGANHAFEPRQEPLTYYHRSGPVGAMFHELRCRKGGADGTAHFAMVGLGTGSASAYAEPGQKITFYEIDPAVKHLTYDSDEYFTYVTGAMKRNAIVDIRMGDARLKLKEATDQKYALLLVDAFSSDSIPVHLLTKEAVQLYLDRMTEDGMLALHISNKFVKLEPVVSAIARDLGLTARVWSDDLERGIGKTASSWVVLARDPAHLGDLYSELGDLPFPLESDPSGDDRMRYIYVRTSGGLYKRSLLDVSLNDCLSTEYSNELEQVDPDQKNTNPDPKAPKKTKRSLLNEADSPTKAWLEWLDQKAQKVTDPREKKRLGLYKYLIEKYGVLTVLHDAMLKEHGHAFRRLEIYAEVHAWTDDYSDVMRVMTLPELQRIRKLFGLPTPLDGE